MLGWLFRNELTEARRREISGLADEVEKSASRVKAGNNEARRRLDKIDEQWQLMDAANDGGLRA